MLKDPHNIVKYALKNTDTKIYVNKISFAGILRPFGWLFKC